MTNNSFDPLRSAVGAPWDPPVLVALRAALHDVATQTISVVTSEVPGYRTLTATERATLAQAVELALRGFVALAAREPDPSSPVGPALEAAVELGRGEARAGRSMDALLAAYRVGARSAWRGLAQAATEAGLPAVGLVGFAELVFAYIDQLSAASVRGHTHELASQQRVRHWHLERLARALVAGAPVEVPAAEAAGAGWTPPARMAAAVVPGDAADAVIAGVTAGALPTAILPPVHDLPGLGPEAAVILLPDPDERLRPALERSLSGAGAVLGHPTPWRDVSRSAARAIRAWRLGLAARPLPRGTGQARTGTDRPETDRRGIHRPEADRLRNDRAGADRVRPDRAGTAPTGTSTAPAGTGTPEGDPAPATRARLAAPGRRGFVIDTEEVLPEILIGSDPDALAALQRRVLAPLAGLRPATAQRLAETLRMWLLMRGRRDEIAGALVIHPQTVRYRVGQLRELFGDTLDDPRGVLELTVALAVDVPR